MFLHGILISMANTDGTSSIYGKPRFGLIVGIFAVAIVALLVCGWIFLKFDPLKLRSGQGHRTGMVLVLPLELTTR